MNKEVAQFLRANSRTPELVIGDLGAQAGALRSIGAARLKTLANEYGGETLTAAFGDIVERVEARACAATSPSGPTALRRRRRSSTTSSIHRRRSACTSQPSSRATV